MRIDLSPALTWSLAIALSGLGVYLWMLVLTAVVKVASEVKNYFALKRRIGNLVLGIIQPENDKAKAN